MSWNEIFTSKNEKLTTRDKHVINVYDDPEFIKDLLYVASLNETDNVFFGSLKDTNKLSRIENDTSLHDSNDVGQKYCITTEEIMDFAMNSKGFMRISKKRPFIINWDEYDINDKEEYFSVSVASDIKKEDFLKIWMLIKHKQTALNKNKTKKIKPAENDSLLYAIFKARIEGISFTNIYKRYELGTLTGYTGRAVQFTNDESLERYYRKYKPILYKKNDISDKTDT